MVYKINDDKKFIELLPKKYKLLYMLGCASGLRVSDIIDIKKSQVENNKRPTIKAKKTGKRKRIFINKKLHKLIREVIDEDKSGSEYLFPNRNNKRLHITRQAVYKTFKLYANKAGIEYNIGTHCMRKKYAAKKYKAVHGNLFEVQKAMQHDKTADTAMYLISAPEKNTKKR